MTSPPTDPADASTGDAVGTGPPTSTTVAATDPTTTTPAPSVDSTPNIGADPEWSDTRDTGLETWGGLEGYETYEIGAKQSPIDLTAAVADDDPDQLAFSYIASAANLENNGHTVVTSFGGDSTLSVNDVAYRLLQFHFHTPSEHTIDGASFPAEFHLVHREDDGDIAVIGVMVIEGDANPVLDATLGYYPDDEGQVAASSDVDPADLLPADRTSFRYDGSLTTPPYSEDIDWYVMTKPITASAYQIAQLEALFGPNNRPVQALGDRSIEIDGAG